MGFFYLSPEWWLGGHSSTTNGLVAGAPLQMVHVLKITQYISLLCNNLLLQTLYGLPYYCLCKQSMCFQRGGCEGADFVEVWVVFFAIFLCNFPSLRFMNTAAMVGSVSLSTKRKFLALDPTNGLKRSLNLAQHKPIPGDVTLFIQLNKNPV